MPRRGSSKALAASASAMHQNARYGPSGEASPNASDNRGVIEKASAAASPARGSRASRDAQAATASVATTPHTTNPMRMAPGVEPSQPNAAITQATMGG